MVRGGPGRKKAESGRRALERGVFGTGSGPLLPGPVQAREQPGVRTQRAGPLVEVAGEEAGLDGSSGQGVPPL